MTMIEKTVQITVTGDHILNGMQCHCERCPIALAATEAIPEAKSIGVTTKTIWIEIDGMPLQSIRLPKVATDFIQRFDNRGYKRGGGESISFPLTYQVAG